MWTGKRSKPYAVNTPTYKRDMRYEQKPSEMKTPFPKVSHLKRVLQSAGRHKTNRI